MCWLLESCVANLAGGVKFDYQGLSSDGRPENVGEIKGYGSKNKIAVPCGTEGSTRLSNSQIAGDGMAGFLTFLRWKIKFARKFSENVISSSNQINPSLLERTHRI